MPDNPQNKAESWMRNVLLGSLALNVFLAGFLFAKVIYPTEIKSEVAPIEFTLRGLPQDLPRDFQEGLEQSFRIHSKEMEENYEALIEARFKVQELLGLEELDEMAMKAALEQVRDLQFRIQIPMHEAFVDAARNMDAEGRREMMFLGENIDVRGLWSPKHFDGARWRVEFDNGEIILELQGITDGIDEDQGEE
ncbi:MAG: periplasmic heavy metal sensor [Nitrospinaceae bacterium]